MMKAKRFFGISFLLTLTFFFLSASVIKGENKNIAPNSSFEYCTEPGLADYWGSPEWGMTDPYWVVHFEEWHRNFGIDEAISFEGKRSMRINNPFDKPGNPDNSALCLRSSTLAVTGNKEYTLSAYLKGEPAGMKVNFAGQEIILTKDWQRYSTTFTAKGEGEGALISNNPSIYPLIKGTFWIDAVQVEEGKEATPYGPTPGFDYYTGGTSQAKIIFPPVENKTFPYTTATPANIPSAVFEFKTQYSLYTREKDLTLEARFGLSPEKLRNAKCLFEIKDAQGKVYLKKELLGNLKPKMEVQLPLKGFADGKYILAGQLLEKGGQIIAKSEAPFLKLPPKPGEVKIDKLSRIITVDGKPYIPFGLAWVGPITYEIMEYLAQNGFTFIVSFAKYEETKLFLDNAAKAGLKVKVGIDGRVSKYKELVGQLKEHPALLAWDLFDEVFAVPGSWARENYQTVVDICQEFQELDPYHPSYLNENSTGLNYLKDKGLLFPGSIVSIDYYPYPPGYIPYLYLATDYAKTMEEMGRKEGKPVWVYPLGSGYAYYANRELTSPEQEFYTYTSLINGVTGFMYWASHPRSKSGWEKIKEMNQEIKQLTPIIASREEIPVIKYSSPSVQILTKRLNRKIYLITLNSSKEPITGRFNLPGRKVKKNSIKVLFENRTLDYTGEFFEDTFAGYQRHVYEIGM